MTFNQPSLIRWHPSKTALDHLSHLDLTKSEYKLILYMMSHTELTMLKRRSSTPDDYHVDTLPNTPPDYAGVFVFSQPRSVIADTIFGGNPNKVTYQIKALVTNNLIIRSNEFSLRLLFGFIMNKTLFDIESPE